MKVVVVAASDALLETGDMDGPAASCTESAVPSVERPGDTEAKSVVPGLGSAAEADRCAYGRRKVVPRPAAENAPFAIAALPRRSIIGRADVRLLPAILRPLPYVPQYVVDAERVGRKGTPRHGADVPVLTTRNQPIMVFPRCA